MTRKVYYLIAVGVIAALTFIPVVYAHGPGAGSWGGSLMGGPQYAMMGGQGMMGGGQGGGMGYGHADSNLWSDLNRMFNGSNQQSHSEIEALRSEIRQRRQELASLVEAAKPDKKLIHEKIEELNRLEVELDRKVAASD